MNFFGRNMPHEFSLKNEPPKDGDVLYQAGEFFIREGDAWVKVQAFERSRVMG